MTRNHQVVSPGFPDVDTKTEILETRTQVGGPVPTALVQLKRFGRTCAFAGIWGSDRVGGDIENDLSREGLDLTPSIRASGHSGFAQVWINKMTGSRTIAFSRGHTGLLRPEHMREDLFAETRVLHLDGSSAEAAAGAARIVKRTGGPVFLDMGGPKPGTDRLLPLVDVAVCPKRAIARHTNSDGVAASVAALLGHGIEAIIVTDGSNGAVAHTCDDRFCQPAFPVSAVDTTGAGDVFRGALIHAYPDGMPWSESLRFASAAAVLKCMALGNRAALPTLQAVEDVVARDR